MKRNILCFTVIWVVLLLVNPVVNVEAKVVFQMEDSVDDDHGPGTYTYPTHLHFEPFKGLFDVQKFAILDGEDDRYILEFTFGEIRDPWRSKYGFSHPLIQIYIDNAPGGDQEIFRPGAQVRLSSKAAWDGMLEITGWWVRYFRPDDREVLKTQDIYWNDAENPFDLKEAKVIVNDKLIQVSLPKTAVGTLAGAKLSVLIGSFDSFGFDHYREVGQKSGDWIFGGSVNPKMSPFVLDVLLPSGTKQSKVLDVPTGADGYVVVPYISVSGGFGLGERELIWVCILIVLLLLAAVIIMKSKKNPISS